MKGTGNDLGFLFNCFREMISDEDDLFSDYICTMAAHFENDGNARGGLGEVLDCDTGRTTHVGWIYA